MDNRPIGVFDSGLGGLTVVKAMKKLLPNESILYFGDTARLPYGVKSKKLVIEYSNQIVKFLIKKNAKMIIVACNTATAMALEELKYNFKDTPIIGVIEPGSIQASLDSINKKIGVIGTAATIKSRACNYALKAIDNNINVVTHFQPYLNNRDSPKERCPLSEYDLLIHQHYSVRIFSKSHDHQDEEPRVQMRVK